MYPIDLSTATMAEVIARSAVCHPTLFAEAMRDVAKVHANHAAHSHHPTAAAVARGMALDLQRMARDCEYDRLHTPGLTLSERIQAFSVACRLQLIPRDTQTAVAQRGEA